MPGPGRTRRAAALDLADSDDSLLDRYAAATGVDSDEEALTLYRLWYDLAEIGS